jgi:predicted PurR-regulated permease PerM
MPSDHARRLIVFLVIASSALTAWIASPFWAAFFLGAVLAAAFRPGMEWLSKRLGGRRSAAAGILTVAVLLVVLLPLAGLTAMLVQRVLEGVAWVREAFASEGVAGLIRRLPGPVEELARRALEALPQAQGRIQDLAGQGGQAAAAGVGGFLAATGSALFQATMTLIAFFFFLTDGRRLVDWLDAHVPLRPGQFRSLIRDFKRTSVSVLVATLATAGIQTLTALVGYLIARAPNPVFLTFLTFLVALIPAVGGTAMVVTVGLLLLATGHPLAGGFLIGWGILVVSLIDNVARPFLLKGGMALHGGVVFFALLGGLSVFGGVGLVLGPLVVTFLLAAMNMYRREFGALPDQTLGPDAIAGAATDPVAGSGREPPGPRADEPRPPT